MNVFFCGSAKNKTYRTYTTYRKLGVRAREAGVCRRLNGLYGQDGQDGQTRTAWPGGAGSCQWPGTSDQWRRSRKTGHGRETGGSANFVGLVRPVRRV